MKHPLEQHQEDERRRLEERLRAAEAANHDVLADVYRRALRGDLDALDQVEAEEYGPALAECRICGERDVLVDGVCEPCTEHEADESEMAQHLEDEAEMAQAARSERELQEASE